MHPNEMAAKMEAEKAYEQTCGVGQEIGGRLTGRSIDECDKQERMIYSLHRRRLNSERENRKLDRVIDILTRHPEFEEFLEVLRSGLV